MGAPGNIRERQFDLRKRHAIESTKLFYMHRSGEVPKELFQKQHGELNKHYTKLVTAVADKDSLVGDFAELYKLLFKKESQKPWPRA